ncbi:hypothetical protein Tco_0636760 [Tanacetum coccineum]
MPTEMELTLEQTQQGVSYEVSKDSILNTAGNPVKEILLKLNLSLSQGGRSSRIRRLFKMVVEVPDSSCLTRSIATCSYPTDKHKDIMKAQLKNFKKDATLKLFKKVEAMSVSPEVSSPSIWQSFKIAKRLCLLMISRLLKITNVHIQFQGTSSIQEVNDHCNIFTRESQECELKTKDKA